MKRPPLPPQDAAMAVVRRLRDHGHTAYLAGGCVRDMLLGREASDYDVATDATPDKICSLFSRTRKVGVQFGVVLVRQGRHWIETATFRTDVNYEDGRRPERVEFTTAEEDARRRDFTVNGLFYDPLEDRVIDYVAGRRDLEDGVIRAIGEPAARFAEDHLRLLRAVRFATRLGFQIEPETARAIRSHAAKIERISPERIREELEKMLAAPKPPRSVRTDRRTRPPPTPLARCRLAPRSCRRRRPHSGRTAPHRRFRAGHGGHSARSDAGPRRGSRPRDSRQQRADRRPALARASSVGPRRGRIVGAGGLQEAVRAPAGRQPDDVARSHRPSRGPAARREPRLPRTTRQHPGERTRPPRRWSPATT